MQRKLNIEEFRLPGTAADWKTNVQDKLQKFSDVCPLALYYSLFNKYTTITTFSFLLLFFFYNPH